MVIVTVFSVYISGTSQGAVVLVDDFNNYTNASYIQVQNPDWSRFGSSTTDGITSIAGGVGGTRGASYSVSWASGSAGYVRYAFSSVQDLSMLTQITLDLNVNTAVAGTLASVQIRSGSTYYQSTTGLSLVNTTYSTFNFDTAASDMTRVAGAGTFSDTLAAVDSIVFVFGNTGGTGSQQIRFDNFNLDVATVPEPSTTMAMGLAGVLLAGSRFLRRRHG